MMQCLLSGDYPKFFSLTKPYLELYYNILKCIIFCSYVPEIDKLVFNYLCYSF